MKSVLISIQPKWCELIASGKKTVEVRKTRPKIATPFKCYIYCTANKQGTKDLLEIHGTDGKIRKANGKVIGEFVCDCITPLYNVCYDEWERLLGGLHRIEKELVGQACLTEKELHSYANGKRCYAWHISDLVIYDKPRELSEFKRACPEYVYACAMCRHSDYTGMRCTPITRPPQSWLYVEVE
ncbi:MAG: ASCH domain-containing protein [Clostridia bacterium]|nr:ASCH domain-containing protein [Clostridia bacterium]